jgi:phage baseplate assembly protein W
MTMHFAAPLTVGPSGSLAVLPQDSDLEVAQSLTLLVATVVGERRSLPEYGIESPLFGGLDPDAAADAIEEWEPRADPVLIDQLVDGVIEVWDLTITGTSIEED